MLYSLMLISCMAENQNSDFNYLEDQYGEMLGLEEFYHYYITINIIHI